MLDLTFDLSTADEVIAKDVPEDVVMTVIKGIMTDKNVEEVIVSAHT